MLQRGTVNGLLGGQSSIMNIMKSSVTIRWNWLLAGVFVGFVAWIAVGGAGFLFLRTVWSDYALAEPTKSYTLLMLFSRLAVGVVCTIFRRWWQRVHVRRGLGSVLVVISAPIHLPERFERVGRLPDLVSFRLFDSTDAIDHFWWCAVQRKG